MDTVTKRENTGTSSAAARVIYVINKLLRSASTVVLFFIISMWQSFYSLRICGYFSSCQSN